MTVPVARASARRTVRVAAGLVAGQAVLCAVIGYVTLGSQGAGGTNAARIVVPAVGGPMPAIPLPRVPPRSPSSSPTTAAPKHPTAVRSTAAQSPAGSRSRHSPAVTPSPPVPAEPPPDILVGSSPPTTEPATAPPSAPSTDSTSTTSSSETTAPSPPVSQSTLVTLGDICEPLDAQATTIDGTAALCRPAVDSLLRWQPAE